MKSRSSLLSPALYEELDLRFSRLAEIMKDKCEAILIADNADLYYASGCFFRGYVYFCPPANPVYFVIRPVGLSGDRVKYIRKPEQMPEVLREMGLPLPANLGLELGMLTYNDVARLSKAFSGVQIVDATMIMRSCRMVKTPYELQMMREDGMRQCAAYGGIEKIYRSGMSDLEFQIEIERLLRLEGCLGFGRMSGNLMEINLGSVISGDNADVPTPYDFAMGGAGVDPSLPVGADGTLMKPGTTVMVDMNGCFNGYQTDMTRVWSIGSIPELALKAHECSRRILRRLEKESLPETPICTMYAIAEEEASQAGLSEYFMGHRQKAGFIGHGVGIELNEQPPITPRNTLPIVENMTLAIEPKFVIPEVGAVGVENTYVTTASGLDNITPFPEEIQELRP